jgi:hypothetical protein
MICPECGTRLAIGVTKCHFCGNEICSPIGTSFIDKFVALFTVFAFIMAVTVLFYTATEDVEASGTLRTIVSFLGAIFLTYLYLRWSPGLINNIIDPLLKK